MKPEELQLGDIVTTTPSGMPIKVVAIHRKKVAYHACTNRFSWVRIGLLQPIPLTPKILEKNGFVKYNEVSDTPPYDKDEEGNMYYSYKGEHKFWGWWQPNNVYLIPVNAMVDLEIKFVHQLQHAMRLCGINKEIEI